MRKTWITIVNVFIMISLLTFVVFYSYITNRNMTQRQIKHFENTTITMEHVTHNYMLGEQRICDVWARYINSKDMTMEEATSFIRISHVLKNASAHIVYSDTLTGLSTRAKQEGSGDYTVTYARTGVLDDVSWISDIGEAINISRAYTNPVNGEQSIAFCNSVTLHDPQTGALRDAILLRVLPLTELEHTWVFPQEEFETAEPSILDEDGDYIIKGHSFKNSSFFEFFGSYNKTDPASVQELFKTITSSTGTFTMFNSRGEECILAYTPVETDGGWAFLSLMPMKDLGANNQNCC